MVLINNAQMETSRERVSKHPRPMMTPLSEDGIKAQLHFLKSILGSKGAKEVLIAQNRFHELKPNSAEEARGARRHRTNAISRIWIDDVFSKDFVKRIDNLAKHRASHAGYDAHLLLSKTGTTSSYQALFDVIHDLGCCTHAKNGPMHAHDAVTACAFVLERLTQCDCWTAYVWDSGHMAPLLASYRGLWYHEAVISVPNLTPRLYFSQGHFARVFEHNDDRSSFRKREAISRSWGIRLHTPGGRALVFLIWRTPGTTGPTVHAIEQTPMPEWLGTDVRIIPKSSRAQKIAEMERSAHADVHESQTLSIALRYIDGWLSEMCESDHSASVQAVESTVLQEAILALFRPLIETQIEGEKRATLKDVLSQLPEVISTTLFEESNAPDDALPRVYLFDEKTGTIDLGADRMYDITGKGVSTRRLSLDTSEHPRELVGRGHSIAGQSLTWASSILMRTIPEFTKKDQPHPDALMYRLLSRNDPREFASELAIWMFSGKEPLGVIGVEARDRNALTRRHVRCLEAISLLVGALANLSRGRFADERELIANTFLRSQDPPAHESELWNTFTQWVKEKVQADLVYAVVHAPGRSKIKAHGLRGSNAFLSAICRAAPDHTLSSRVSALLNADDERLPEETVTDLRQQAIAEIIEDEHDDAAHSVLRGLRGTHAVMTRRKDLPSWIHRFIRDADAIGIAPLPIDKLASNVCLRIGWMDKSPTNRPSKDQTMLRRILRVGSVFASLHVMYRLNELVGHDAI